MMSCADHEYSDDHSGIQNPSIEAGTHFLCGMYESQIRKVQFPDTNETDRSNPSSVSILTNSESSNLITVKL